MADPRIVKHPHKIEVVTYRELRELSYMGANVFHEEAMFPVLEAGIPTRILNTNAPEEPGTLITSEKDALGATLQVTGIAGRKDFFVITIEKRLMNQEVGFARRILSVLERNAVSFEHMPSGIDSVSIIIDSKLLNGRLSKIIDEIKRDCSPDRIETSHNMAMVAVVGRAMVHTPGVAAKVFDAIAAAKINVRMINQGSSEISIIIGVNNSDYETAIRSIYRTFIED